MSAAPESGERAVAVWWVVVTTLTGAGQLMVPFVFDARVVVARCSVLALVVAVVLGSIRQLQDGHRGSCVALVARDWALATVIGLSLFGWNALLGPTVVLLVLGLMGCSPLIWSRAGSGRAAPPIEFVDEATPPPLLELRGHVTAMTVAEIAAGWRRTGVRLTVARDAPTRAELVRVRQAYLDELVRRDPTAVRAWLDAQPLGSSDPTVHFGPHDPPDAITL